MRWFPRSVPLLLPGLLLAQLLAGGCSTYDAARARQTHTDAFTNTLARLAAKELERPLSLDDCVRIALVNNYEVRKADLDRELNRIGRNVAFTAFLPTVSAKAGYSAYAKQPNIMTERRFGSASLDIGMPVFMPSTWFLYAAARQGYAAAGIAAHYVRQGIVLQTTMNYCETLVQQETVTALEAQVQAARENAARVAGLAREGLCRTWEADQANLLAASRQAELDHARRQLTVASGELLVGLGLSPDAPVTLSGDTGTATVPTNSVPELVLLALETNPALSLADRNVVIQEHRVRQAFCDFLPSLSLFTSGTWTANDLEDHASNWHAGLSGTWTLFDGLANVARYKASKVDRRKSELERENTFLNVMVQVIAAEAAWHDATDTAALRQRAYEVASAKSSDYDAKAREGLLPQADALDARAAMDLAQVELVRARYLERIALATLDLALGTTPLPEVPPQPR